MAALRALFGPVWDTPYKPGGATPGATAGQSRLRHRKRRPLDGRM
jgi:hypothetical protein